jgi:hypothetical protein
VSVLPVAESESVAAIVTDFAPAVAQEQVKLPVVDVLVAPETVPPDPHEGVTDVIVSTPGSVIEYA